MISTIEEVYDLFAEALGEAMMCAGLEPSTIEEILEGARVIIEDKTAGTETASEDEVPDIDPDAAPLNDMSLENAILNFTVHLVRYHESALTPPKEARERVAQYLCRIADGLRDVNKEKEA
jgi:hypothetical protein